MSFLTKFERWDPFDELSTLRGRMDRLWSRMNTEEEEPVLADWMPATDVIETKDEITLKAELPGIDEKDIEVEIVDGILTIKGERKVDKKTEEEGYRRIERSYGKFSRSLSLPEGVDPDAIGAEFHDGVLDVRIPKPEERKPRRISVKAGANGKPATIEGTSTESS
jgi:HSP20 family protein